MLEVNALIAWRHATANGHARFHTWASAKGFDTLVTCAPAELGFIRVSMRVFRLSLADAQTALTEMKKHVGGFIAEAPSPRLPAGAKKPGQTSDAYLQQIAAAHGAQLATLVTGIPGTEQI